MDNKKDKKQTMEVPVVKLTEKDTKELVETILEMTNKHTDEMIKKLEKKAVVVSKSDVNKAVEEVLDAKAKKEAFKNPEEKQNEEPEVERIVEVQEDEDDKVGFSIKSALKYAGVGFLGAAAGVAGKTVYNRYDTRKKIRMAEDEMERSRTDSYED